MEITLHRKLLEATFNCTSTTPCTDPYAYYYYCCCVNAPAPSPVADQSPPSGGPHNHNHAVPYLVSAACLLGVLSLILTTCTILLRHRFSRSPRVASSRDPHAASVNEDHAPVDHPIWHIVTVGLPQSAIDSIASVKYKSSEGLIEESDCSVCLTGFEDGDDLRLLPKCSHAFHLPCIDTWLSSHKSCPLCRSPVVNDSPPANVNLRDSSPNSSSPGPSETALIDNSDSLDDYDNDSSHVEGAEVLKSDPEKRVLSGLGVAREDFEAVRRSISLDSSAAVDNVGIQTGEGSSQQEKMIELEEADKEGHIGESGISRLIKSSSSIGRSSAKILSSLRGSKSQSSSTLPHM